MNTLNSEPKYRCPPILFIIFNRPDLGYQVFKRIREAQPKKLFIAADGPRDEVTEDIELCNASRQIVKMVDWDCEIQTLFQPTNQGCKLAESAAINWFFKNIDEGIILEDDCVPDLSFFRYCSELLSYSRNDTRIMHISGDNFQQGIKRTQYSYYFSRWIHLSGWATWQRAWKYYDADMKSWPILRDTDWLNDIHGNESIAMDWGIRFDRAYNSVVNSYGYPWTYSCWVQNGMAILPEVNLVSHIGIGPSATHTKTANPNTSNLPTSPVEFPLNHPSLMVRNTIADLYTGTKIFSRKSKDKKSFLKRIYGYLTLIRGYLRINLI